MKKTLTFASLAGVALAANAQAQTLLVPESTNDTVMSFSAMDGSLINGTFIDLSLGTGTAAATPIEVAELPNGELIISDQIADVIHRWSADGTTYLGESAVPLDNMRGLDVAYGSVWVANSGTNNGAPGDALVQLDLNLGLVANHVGVGDPFDTNAYTLGGVAGIMLTDIAGEDLVFVDPANPLTPTIFHDSDGVSGIDFPEQVSNRLSGTNVLAGGFTTPSGLYEYDATGTQVDYVDTSALFGLGGIRGVYELGNGNLMFTNGGGVHIYDPVAGTATTVMAGVSARFISEVGSTPGTGTAFCDPGNVNSTGGPAVLTGSMTNPGGSGLHLECVGGPSGEFGYFLVGTAPETMNPITVGSGLLCLSASAPNQVGRYNQMGGDRNSVGQFDTAGVLQNIVGTSTVGSGYDVPTLLPFGGSIMAGSTWHFQVWHRDTPNMMGDSNLSNGLSVTF